MGDIAAYALQTLTSVANPDDRYAMTRSGELKKSTSAMKRWLVSVAPRPEQPPIAAAICLLGSNCDLHQNYLIETLKFADSRPVLGMLRSY
jgi:hypothetical protein